MAINGTLTFPDVPGRISEHNSSTTAHSVRIDDTVSEAGMAAEAKAVKDKLDEITGDFDDDLKDLTDEVTDLKSAITCITGNEEITQSDPTLRQYIPIGSVGSTVSWDTPSITSSLWSWAVVECAPGDKFTISGKGANATSRLWAFADSEKKLLSKSTANLVVKNTILTAPEDAAYLIINTERGAAIYAHCFIGEFLNSRFTSYTDDVNNKIRTISHAENLLPIENYTSSVVGITRVYENGKLTESGTASSNGGGTSPIIPEFTIPAGTYCLWTEPYNGSFALRDSLDGTVYSWSNERTFTLESEKTVYISFVQYAKNTSYDREFFIELKRGSKSYYTKPSYTNGIDIKSREDIADLTEDISISSSAIEQLQSDVISKTPVPMNSFGPDFGTAGQVLATKGNGTTEWKSVATPTSEEIADAITEWLGEHPEATTTVQDRSITSQKLAIGAIEFVTPEMYGAVGDGETDDTVAIKSAFSQTLANVVVLSRNYSVTVTPSEQNAITVRSGMTILFLGSTISLHLDDDYYTGTDNSRKHSRIIIIDSVHDVTVTGHGRLVGTKLNQQIPSGEWHHGIEVYNSDHVVIEGLTIENCVSDGICLSGSTSDLAYYNSDVTIRNTILDSNGRNGISIISAELVRIDGCTLKNTVGNPAFGIDCEANGYWDRLTSIFVTNCYFENNYKGAVNFYAPKKSNDSSIAGVTCNAVVSNCICDGCIAFYASGDYSSLIISNTKVTPPAVSGTRAPNAFIMFADATSHVSVSNCTVLLVNNGTGVFEKNTPANGERTDYVEANITINNTYVYEAGESVYYEYSINQ